MLCLYKGEYCGKDMCECKCLGRACWRDHGPPLQQTPSVGDNPKFTKGMNEAKPGRSEKPCAAFRVQHPRQKKVNSDV